MRVFGPSGIIYRTYDCIFLCGNVKVLFIAKTNLGYQKCGIFHDFSVGLF